MPGAKSIQRPVVRPRPTGQVAKRQVFLQALLQPPRAAYLQTVGVQPHFHPHRRRVGTLPFVAIIRRKRAPIQAFHHPVNKQAEMLLPQHSLHTGRQQPGLIGIIGP